MAHSNKVGLGRVTISSRERPDLVEPRGAGLVMSTLRSADEVCPAQFGAKRKSPPPAGLVPGVQHLEPRPRWPDTRLYCESDGRRPLGTFLLSM